MARQSRRPTIAREALCLHGARALPPEVNRSRHPLHWYTPGRCALPVSLVTCSSGARAANLAQAKKDAPAQDRDRIIVRSATQ
jgi:hypothetical protein